MKAVTALIGAAALALTSMVVAPAAASAAAGYCASGVLVVVDFGSLGGGVARGCASSPGTGLAALHDAGFTTEGTKHDGPAFVCRINSRPSRAQDACVRTPPASAYWSYWHAKDGQKSWSYSQLGASSYHPRQGQMEGWAFGSTDVGGTSGGPSFCPDYARTQRQSSCGTSGGGRTQPKPKPKPTNAKSQRREDDSGDDASTDGAGGSSSRSRSVTVSKSVTPSRSRTTGASSTRPSASTASGGDAASGSLPPIVDASEVAGKDTSTGTGSALSAILGAALVALLAGGAGWTVLRRRRAGAADL